MLPSTTRLRTGFQSLNLFWYALCKGKQKYSMLRLSNQWIQTVQLKENKADQKIDFPQYFYLKQIFFCMLKNVSIEG